MRNIFVKAAISAVLFGAFAGQASAAGWEIWTEKQGSDQLVIVTSFSGDGELDEAQVDLSVMGGFEILEAKSLMKGAICAGFKDQSMLRSVPPSGAGSALKSQSTDACMFTIRVTGAKVWTPSEVLKANPICASSTKGMVSCDASMRSVK